MWNMFKVNNKDSSNCIFFLNWLPSVEWFHQSFYSNAKQFFKENIVFYLNFFVEILNIMRIVWKFVLQAFSQAKSFKVNNGNTRKMYEVYSKLNIKTQERRQLRCSGVFVVNFENIPYLFLVFLLLTLSKESHSV